MFTKLKEMIDNDPKEVVKEIMWVFSNMLICGLEEVKIKFLQHNICKYMGIGLEKLGHHPVTIVKVYYEGIYECFKYIRDNELYKSDKDNLELLKDIFAHIL